MIGLQPKRSLKRPHVCSESRPPSVESVVSTVRSPSVNGRLFNTYTL